MDNKKKVDLDLYLKEYHKDVIHYQTHINQGLITYNGLIVTLSGSLIGFTKLNEIPQIFFTLGIITIMLGLFCHFEKFNISFKELTNKENKLRKIRNNYPSDEQQNLFRKEVNEEDKPSCYEEILEQGMKLQSLGQIFFLLGMLSLVICSF